MPNADALFNALDPAPLPGRALDDAVAAYISDRLDAAQAPREAVVRLIVHVVQTTPEVGDRTLAQALRQAFAIEAERSSVEFRMLMKEGRRSLAVSAAFILIVAALVIALWQTPDNIPLLVGGAITIAFWALFWRPVEIFFYDWWPIRTRARQWRALAGSQIEVRHRPAP